MLFTMIHQIINHYKVTVNKNNFNAINIQTYNIENKYKA